MMRVARAYGVMQAVLGSVVIIVVAIVVGRTTLGVTRQPLPLVWPLAVLHVVVAQVPLREILGPFERTALRGPLVRGVRAAVALLLLTIGPLTYTSTKSGLPVFLLGLGVAGFLAAARPGPDPWVWTLGIGMAVVGVIFITGFGEPVNSVLRGTPIVGVVAALVLAAGVYVLKGPALVGSLPRPGPNQLRCTQRSPGPAA